MSIASIFIIVAATVFGVEAWWHKSLLALGLCLYMIALVINR